MSASTGRTATSLGALTDLLGLHPRPTGAPSRPSARRLGVVAGRSGPRFLVPLDDPAATPEACLAYLGLRDVRTRVARGGVGLALKARLGRFVIDEELEADAGPGSLIALLQEVLADPEHPDELAVAVGLGTQDEVWKPTLQVFRPDGTPAAFVKIGLGPVADRLVGTEAEALATWHRHPDPRLVVPDLIADTTWNGTRIAVVAPLPTDARRLPTGRLVSAWPVRELDGPLRHGPIADAPWWTGRVEACAAHERVAPLLAHIAERHADLDPAALAWGRWHGDWVPWNLARCHRGLVAWDWEYAEPDAPVGLDEVHGAYQQARVVEGRSVVDALAVARAAAGHLVATGTSPTSPGVLRAQAGTPAPALHRTPAGAAAPERRAEARWLADAHVAMLATRSAELERLLGRPPGDQLELLAAADAALAETTA